MTVLKAKIGGTYQAILSGYTSNVFVGPSPPTDPNIQFWIDTDAVLPVVPWVVVTAFQNGWSNVGGGYQIARYRKIGDIVYLEGNIQGGSANLAMFTLPVGYRPPLALEMAQFGYNSSTGLRAMNLVSVDANGIVRAENGAPISSNISGLSFSVTA